MVKLILLK